MTRSRTRRSSLAHISAVLASMLALGATSHAGTTVGYLTIEGELPEREAMAPLWFAPADNMTLPALIRTINDAAADDDINALVLRLQSPALSLQRVEELGEAITRFRSTGKKVHLFGEIYDQPEVVLGSYCDDVIIQRGAAVTFTGLYMEEMFLKDALNWAGITPDFIQIGDYKGASEMYAQSAPTKAWDQNINQLLDGLYANMTRHVMDGRGLTTAELERAMSSGIFIEPEDAVRSGLADAAIDRLELDERMEQTYGEEFEWDLSLAPGGDAADFASMGFFEAFSTIMKSMESASRETTRDTIAVVHIDGPIMDGESSSGGFMSSPSVGSTTIREALAEIEDDRNIRGVIVRINSPGGSAIASESIWIGLRRIAEKGIPVWASVGEMAASGGYYIAVASDKIYVNPSSIVGSIGVVGGKLALGGMWDKVHVNVVPRTRGPMAGVLGSLGPWNDAERAAVERSMKNVYEQFVERVRRGRKGIEIDETAEGRLFTGSHAIERKMADAIGGLETTIGAMASSLGLERSNIDVLDYPAPLTLEEILQGGFSLGASAAAEHPLAEAIKPLVGDHAWDALRDAASAITLLRKEPVLLVSPSILIFK